MTRHAKITAREGRYLSMLAQWDEFEHLLRQPAAPDTPVQCSRRGETIQAAQAENADAKSSEFALVNGQPVLIDFSRSLIQVSPSTWAGESPISRRPNWIRIAKGWLFGTANLSAHNFKQLRTHLIAAGTPRPFLLMIGAATRGAGTSVLYDDDSLRQIAFDIYPSDDTHFVADAHHIPLATGSVDAVCAQAVLEHVLDPVQVVSEITRVLRPGGLVYAETPFMQQVHEGAYDFTRWSELGHRWLWRNFEAISRGPLGGPGLSLYWAAKYFFRGLTRSKILGDILSLPFALAAKLDRFIGEDHKIDGANGVYFLGRVKRNCATLGSIVGEYRGAQH